MNYMSGGENISISDHCTTYKQSIENVNAFHHLPQNAKFDEASCILTIHGLKDNRNVFKTICPQDFNTMNVGCFQYHQRFEHE